MSEYFSASLDYAKQALVSLNLDKDFAVVCPSVMKFASLTYTSYCDDVVQFLSQNKHASWSDYVTPDHATESPLKSYLVVGLVFFLLFIIARFFFRTAKSFVPVDRRGLNREVYLISSAVFTDFKEEHYVNPDRWFSHIEQYFGLTPESSVFTCRVLQRSGIGGSTHLPESILSEPPNISIRTAREEAHLILTNVVDKAFKEGNINPKEIDIVIVNCSLFAPTPSLGAMIINHYKMREDVVIYNLGGMGCSAGLISVDLAADMLQMSLKKNPVALVVSMENLSQNLYYGSDRSMLVTNALFRMGGAAVVLTNTPNKVNNRKKAVYKLTNLVRVHLGRDDEAYKIVYQDIDDERKVGVRLEKNLTIVAGKALTKNVSILGNQILPLHEKIRYVLRLAIFKLRTSPLGKKLGITIKPKPEVAQDTTNKKKPELSPAIFALNHSIEKAVETFGIAGQKAVARVEASTGVPYTKPIPSTSSTSPANSTSSTASPRPVKEFKPTPPVPNFMTAVDYVAIHAGGRGVIDAIQQGFGFSDADVEASRTVLHKYGNTSSSSIWYEFKEIEANRLVKKGQKIWQIAFGSGFKCNTAVWQKM